MNDAHKFGAVVASILVAWAGMGAILAGFVATGYVLVAGGALAAGFFAFWGSFV